MKQTSFEQTINHVIANGARIQEAELGTVLPTTKSLRLSNEYAARVKHEQAATAAKSKELSRCSRRVEGGEVRYYASATRFAVVGRSNVIRWFEVRNGATYAAK